MPRMDKAAVTWLLKRLAAVYVTGGLLLYVLRQPLDHFLAARFPDPGKDDLTLAYVIDKLPVHLFILLVTAVAVLILLGIYWKKYAYFGMALLAFNLVFYVLVRSNFEFYHYFVISGPLPWYGGLWGAYMIAGIAVSLAGWFILDCLPVWGHQARKIITGAGMLLVVNVCCIHLGPVITRVLSTGW